MSELNEFEQFYRRQAQIWRNIYLSTSDESLKKQAQREFETYNQRLPQEARLER